jgi:hypothetical protein
MSLDLLLGGFVALGLAAYLGPEQDLLILRWPLPHLIGRVLRTFNVNLDISLIRNG